MVNLGGLELLQRTKPKSCHNFFNVLNAISNNQLDRNKIG
jgi:hypothetical protein